jgi:hypothetical protein
MYNNANRLTQEFLRPLCEVWRERLNAAKRAKEPFQKVSRQCMDFFRAGAGFMWGNEHRNMFFDGKLPVPRFKITVALPYEYVSIYGPHLFWQYAGRKVFSQRQVELNPLLFGDIQNDPNAQAAFQQAKAADDQDRAATAYINELISSVLNWAQREQPNGLVSHGRMCTVEALVTGGGLLAPEIYTFPGSTAKLPRSRYVPIESLLIDPDCKDPLWEEAGWIAIRHSDPVWQVERRFGLKKNALAGKGHQQSAEMTAREQSNHNGYPGKGTHDMITWWEIYSRCGIGPRTEKLNHVLLDEFDDAIGDYAYLCVAEGVDYPLNAPAERFLQGSAEDGSATAEELVTAFEWRFVGYGDPFPIWKDNRWPVEPLMFDRIPGTPWPMPPMAAGLGELIAINILTSAYVDITWTNRKRIIGYLKSCVNDVEKAVNSDESFSFVAINDNVQGALNNMIQFLDAPRSKEDILVAIEKLRGDFYRRVGLNELMYGESSTQIRVAADIRGRSESSQIRPEKMSMDVAEWMSRVSQSEMMAAVMYTNGEDLVHLLGEHNAQAWDMLVKQIPIERLMREAKTTVEASELRRPNHERDTANAQALQQYLMPVLQMYAQSNGNYEPLNGFIKSIGESMEMDVSQFLMPSTPPDPEQMKLQQQAQQTEIQETAASAQHKTAQAAKAKAEAVATLAEIAGGDGESPEAGPDPMLEQAHMQKMRHNEELHNQKLIAEQEKLVQDMVVTEAQAALDEKLKKQQLAQKKATGPRT